MASSASPQRSQTDPWFALPPSARWFQQRGHFSASVFETVAASSSPSANDTDATMNSSSNTAAS